MAVIRAGRGESGSPALQQSSAWIVSLDGREPRDGDAGRIEVSPGEHELRVEGRIVAGPGSDMHPRGTLRFTAVAGGTYELLAVRFTGPPAHMPYGILLMDVDRGVRVATSESPERAISARIDFGDRAWHLAGWSRTETVALTTWLPDGQTLADWQELLETQAFVHRPDLGPGPDGVLQDMVAGMVEQWSGRRPPVTWAERPRGDGTRLLEWSGDKGDGRGLQHGVTLMRVQDGCIHQLAYVARSPEVRDANADRWVAAFAAAPLSLPDW